jgi:Tfp pilus tip-associated adhesin PilY1
MQKRLNFLWILIVSTLILHSTANADDSALFNSVAPDALIVLDLSGSMNWTPAGQTMYTLNGQSCNSNSNPFYDRSGTGHTTSCSIDPYGSVPKYSDTSCAGPFYRTSGSGHTTDCSRVMIARSAIFKILDDNGDGTINTLDEQTLGIRLGFMSFYNCNAPESSLNYNSGCNTLKAAIGNHYATIWNGGSGWSGVNGMTSASGGTPLVATLSEAKLYLDASKTGDAAAACRQKFAILITDGSDTYDCGGNGTESQTDQYKRRRDTVAAAQALAAAGYKVFVVGFGSDMPYWSQNTLNWAAFYGGTDNPDVENQGNTGAYNPSSVTSCQTSPTGSDGNHYYATSNDPGEIPLSGYAFLASSASDLISALTQAISIIREATYSFSLASIASTRTQDENNIYEGSFQPLNNGPFWLGHLEKYDLNSDGTVGSMEWDAGSVLQSMSASSRNIYTYKAGNLTAFTTSNIAPTDLGLTTNSDRDAKVGYVRGDPTYNPDDWKLGDIYHSNPLAIGTPSSSYVDSQDMNNAFGTFQSNHQRTSANGQKVVVAGSNDGQIHSFRTLDGREVWSFIPPNLLTKIKNIAHTALPSGLTHQFFVDGPVAAADVWLGSGDGTHKNPTDWMTLLIFGEGRGGGVNLWSSSPSCDSGTNPLYTSTYSNYCGYYAFDFTTPTSPVYKWRINPTSTQAPYLGDPWSQITFGRVRINGNEKWVGFMGGGYNAANCAGGGSCDSRGKGFFVVDLMNGNILWSYTISNNTSMNYSFPAPPAAVDADNDGFIDTVYLGDLGGNMWRFKFCSKIDGTTCDTSNWSGGFLFQTSTGNIRPIYTEASVAKDTNGFLWVYWGTGDTTDPTATNAQDYFYAVKDNDRTTTYLISNLVNVTSGTYTDSTLGHGWYISLAGVGEKVLAEPTVFGGNVYFSSYTPVGSGGPCTQGGTATLYGLNYVTAAAGLVLTGTSGGSRLRSITVGTGIPTAPVISLKPAGAMPPDLYVTVSGGGSTGASTTRPGINPPVLSSRTNILTWKDRRLQ